MGSSWDRQLTPAQCAAYLGGGAFLSGAGGARPANITGLCARFGGAAAARPAGPACSALCVFAKISVVADNPPCSGDSDCPAPAPTARRRFCCGFLAQAVAAGCAGADPYRVAALDVSAGPEGLQRYNLSDLCSNARGCEYLSAARRARPPGARLAAAAAAALLFAAAAGWSL